MTFHSSRLPYRQTNAFSSIALDYIDQDEKLRPFFQHSPSIQGIRDAIAARKSFTTDRQTLVAELKKAYASIKTHTAVSENIENLARPNTFTVTTAHQNNIFTGPLYVIYKIIHAVRIASHLNQTLKDFSFVPVFYMGSEDADLPELNHINLGNEKLEWQTKQEGAVGRMRVDRQLRSLLQELEGRLNVLPFGKEITGVLSDCYQEGSTIQDATFSLLNELFGEYGLVVLIADNRELKKSMHRVFEEELLKQSASEIVASTNTELLSKHYKTQANPREINLFYLEENSRERIERSGDQWKVLNTNKQLGKDEIIAELKAAPEKFSPNVILRGLYQETILPNIAFVGGAGELAYWLQLKGLFQHYGTPFPVLVLRNSYLVVEKKWREKIHSLGFEIEDFFKPEDELLKHYILRAKGSRIGLNGAVAEIQRLYADFRKQASSIDPTLGPHVDALLAQATEKLQVLEKKMIRAEKRKHADQQRQIHRIKQQLFPGGDLQERHQNFTTFYALWGRRFLRELLEHACSFEQEFCVLSES